MIYITSDLHFGHDKPFIYGARGFDTVEEHDRALVDNWNSVVSDDDTVYVLGDIMLKDNENGIRCWNQLKGKKKILLGNHDSALRVELLKECENTEILGYAYLLKHAGKNLYLSHYPTITSNYDDDKQIGKRVFNVCGHVHTTDRFSDMDKGFIYHVEPECHGNMPVPIDEVISDMEEYRSR